MLRISQQFSFSIARYRSLNTRVGHAKPQASRSNQSVRSTSIQQGSVTGPQKVLRKISNQDVGPRSSLLDFARLPRLDRSHVIHFTGVDYETVTAVAIRNKFQPIYRHPLFTFRSFPVRLLPVRPPSPFPWSPDKSKEGKIRFGVIPTKTHVSKLATERNRVRNRFKEAVNMVVNRGFGGRKGVKRETMVSKDRVYLARVNRGVYDVPFSELCQLVYNALTFVNKSQRTR